MRNLLVTAIGLMMAVGVGTGLARAEGDATKGEKIFKKCAACHSVIPGKKKVGPSLHGIVGRTPGTADGFKYSKAMKAYGETGAVWGEETLDPWLAKPRAFLTGTRMAFPGLKKEQDRADVIAYLKTFSEKKEPCE